MDNGIWQFPGQMGNGIGFIYIIRDNWFKQFYLGKKLYLASDGKGGKERSNWRRYKSSSNIVKGMLKERPMEEFDFICLEEYHSKGGLSYAETWTLCLVEAPTTIKWHNKRIEAISWKVKENITIRHKERLKRILNMENMYV